MMSHAREAHVPFVLSLIDRVFRRYQTRQPPSNPPRANFHPHSCLPRAKVEPYSKLMLSWIRAHAACRPPASSPDTPASALSAAVAVAAAAAATPLPRHRSAGFTSAKSKRRSA